MKYPKYPFVMGKNEFIYHFDSAGPSGNIRKAVFYTFISENIYNLGFGDWNEEQKDFDDERRTNNQDRDKVLATVAQTANLFTQIHPQAKLFIEGSTPARTRLYQMGISRNLAEINEEFLLFGLTADGWELFQPGVNYSAFLAARK